ncbi:hypothetical protein LB505_007566 [Fusarium chuoi]|nr:hypothetical protein LB505_007566 [Fusarium chuoi]
MQHEDKPEVWDNIQASAVLALKTFGLEVTTSKAAEQTCFPNLRRLKLTRIPLRDESAGTQVIASSIDSIHRTTPHDIATSKAANISESIDCFKGVVEPFISVCSPTPSLQFWGHAAGYAASLEIFVYHQRLTDQDEELLNSRLGRYPSDLGLSFE